MNKLFNILANILGFILMAALFTYLILGLTN
jgi:uncharacterized membrane protein YuzA (DUF378 family)